MSALRSNQWAIDEDMITRAIEQGAGSRARLQRMRAAVDAGTEVIGMQTGRVIPVVELEDAIRCARA